MKAWRIYFLSNENETLLSVSVSKFFKRYPALVNMYFFFYNCILVVNVVVVIFYHLFYLNLTINGIYKNIHYTVQT